MCVSPVRTDNANRSMERRWNIIFLIVTTVTRAAAWRTTISVDKLNFIPEFWMLQISWTRWKFCFLSMCLFDQPIKKKWMLYAIINLLQTASKTTILHENRHTQSRFDLSNNIVFHFDIVAFVNFEFSSSENTNNKYPFLQLNAYLISCIVHFFYVSAAAFNVNFISISFAYIKYFINSGSRYIGTFERLNKLFDTILLHLLISRYCRW